MLKCKRLAALLLAAVMALSCTGALAGETALNVLLIGVDAAGDGERGRSDTMILARVDPAEGSIRLVSFLRDLYVSIPGVGKTRLNAAYQHGGEALLKETLENTFGVAINRTVTVNFSLLADLVDQLGGVEVEITEKERGHLNDIIADYNADHGLDGGRIAEAGMQRLDGRQALCYSRIRKIDSDFQRASRQQAVIAAMLRQMSMLRRWELLKLAVYSLGRVQTDVTLGDLVALAPLMTQLDQTEISTAHIPFEGAFHDETIRGMMVLTADIGLCKTYLHRFLSGS